MLPGDASLLATVVAVHGRDSESLKKCGSGVGLIACANPTPDLISTLWGEPDKKKLKPAAFPGELDSRRMAVADGAGTQLMTELDGDFLPMPALYRDLFRSEVCFSGILPEIGMVWISVESRLYLWHYSGSAAAAEEAATRPPIHFSGLLLDVCLSVPPARGLFFADAAEPPYVLAVSTTENLSILLVRDAVGDARSYSIEPPPMAYTVPTPCPFLRLASAPCGRLFGTDANGALSFIDYRLEQARGWLASQAEPRFSVEVQAPQFPRGLGEMLGEWLGESRSAPSASFGRVVDLAVDGVRGCVYVLFAAGTIGYACFDVDPSSIHRHRRPGSTYTLLDLFKTARTVDAEFLASSPLPIRVLPVSITDGGKADVIVVLDNGSKALLSLEARALRLVGLHKCPRPGQAAVSQASYAGGVLVLCEGMQVFGECRVRAGPASQQEQGAAAEAGGSSTFVQLETRKLKSTGWGLADSRVLDVRAQRAGGSATANACLLAGGILTEPDSSANGGPLLALLPAASVATPVVLLGSEDYLPVFEPHAACLNDVLSQPEGAVRCGSVSELQGRARGVCDLALEQMPQGDALPHQQLFLVLESNGLHTLARSTLWDVYCAHAPASAVPALGLGPVDVASMLMAQWCLQQPGYNWAVHNDSGAYIEGMDGPASAGSRASSASSLARSISSIGNASPRGAWADQRSEREREALDPGAELKSSLIMEAGIGGRRGVGGVIAGGGAASRGTSGNREAPSRGVLPVFDGAECYLARLLRPLWSAAVVTCYHSTQSPEVWCFSALYQGREESAGMAVLNALRTLHARLCDLGPSLSATRAAQRLAPLCHLVERCCDVLSLLLEACCVVPSDDQGEAGAGAFMPQLVDCGSPRLSMLRGQSLSMLLTDASPLQGFLHHLVFSLSAGKAYYRRTLDGDECFGSHREIWYRLGAYRDDDIDGRFADRGFDRSPLSPSPSEVDFAGRGGRHGGGGGGHVMGSAARPLAELGRLLQLHEAEVDEGSADEGGGKPAGHALSLTLAALCCASPRFASAGAADEAASAGALWSVGDVHEGRAVFALRQLRRACGQLAPPLGGEAFAPGTAAELLSLLAECSASLLAAVPHWHRREVNAGSSRPCNPALDWGTLVDELHNFANAAYLAGLSSPEGPSSSQCPVGAALRLLVDLCLAVAHGCVGPVDHEPVYRKMLESLDLPSLTRDAYSGRGQARDMEGVAEGEEEEEGGGARAALLECLLGYALHNAGNRKLEEAVCEYYFQHDFAVLLLPPLQQDFVRQYLLTLLPGLPRALGGPRVSNGATVCAHPDGLDTCLDRLHAWLTCMYHETKRRGEAGGEVYLDQSRQILAFYTTGAGTRGCETIGRWEVQRLEQVWQTVATLGRADWRVGGRALTYADVVGHYRQWMLAAVQEEFVTLAQKHCRKLGAVMPEALVGLCRRVLAPHEWCSFPAVAAEWEGNVPMGRHGLSVVLASGVEGREGVALRIMECIEGLDEGPSMGWGTGPWWELRRALWRHVLGENRQLLCSRAARRWQPGPEGDGFFESCSLWTVLREAAVRTGWLQSNTDAAEWAASGGRALMLRPYTLAHTRCSTLPIFHLEMLLFVLEARRGVQPRHADRSEDCLEERLFGCRVLQAAGFSPMDMLLGILPLATSLQASRRGCALQLVDALPREALAPLLDTSVGLLAYLLRGETDVPRWLTDHGGLRCTEFLHHGDACSPQDLRGLNCDRSLDRFLDALRHHLAEAGGREAGQDEDRWNAARTFRECVMAIDESLGR